MLRPAGKDGAPRCVCSVAKRGDCPVTGGSPSVTGVYTELLARAMVWRFDGWPWCLKLGSSDVFKSKFKVVFAHFYA